MIRINQKSNPLPFMKTSQSIASWLSAALVAVSALTAHAQLVIPGADGSDGTLFPLETNVVIDLSQAVTGAWDQASPVPSKGVYDPTNWVVVFKYRNVVIPQGFTVRFTNHPSRAPVVWLVQNNANIDGVVDVSGSINTNTVDGLSQPGPGGFRGGSAALASSLPGPGLGSGGGYLADGQNNYGSSRILPLIGGSGGSGFTGTPKDYTGGSGGGAILIAAQRTITVNGSILANGGPVVNANIALGGAGGAIKLIGNQVSGAGSLQALGTTGRALAGDGRIRIETPSISQSLSINPPTVAVQPSNPVEIVPSATAPAARILSFVGSPAPVEPLGGLGNSGTDLVLTNSTPIDLLIETRNMPTNSQVLAILRAKNNYTDATRFPSIVGNSASFSARATYLSGNASIATWRVFTNMPIGHFTVQVRAVTP